MPVSNPAQLTSVVAIFGGPGSLSVYIAGGSYVPPGTSGPNGAVPSSLPIQLSKLADTVNFTPGTVTYTSSSGSFTVPSGTVTLVIEAVGGAGAGGYGSYDFVAEQAYGGGGGGGGAKSNTSVAASGGGQSLSWSVGRGGNYVDGLYGVASTVSGGLITTMTAGGGTPGSSGQPTGQVGSGGTASGGNVSDSIGYNGDQGDAYNAGAGGSSYSSGGTGGYGASAEGDPGANGYVTFTWS